MKCGNHGDALKRWKGVRTTGLSVASSGDPDLEGALPVGGSTAEGLSCLRKAEAVAYD